MRFKELMQNNITIKHLKTKTMIAANELRIGNYCEYYIEDKMEKSDPGFWVKNKIDLQDIECCLNNKEHFDKFYRAMHLTPEILEKCGFEQYHDNCFNDVMYIKNIFGGGKMIWGVYPNELGSGIIIKASKPLESLHQLQNLIFALTGTELEIKDVK